MVPVDKQMRPGRKVLQGFVTKLPFKNQNLRCSWFKPILVLNDEIEINFRQSAQNALNEATRFQGQILETTWLLI